MNETILNGWPENLEDTYMIDSDIHEKALKKIIFVGLLQELFNEWGYSLLLLQTRLKWCDVSWLWQLKSRGLILSCFWISKENIAVPLEHVPLINWQDFLVLILDWLFRFLVNKLHVWCVFMKICRLVVLDTAI